MKAKLSKARILTGVLRQPFCVRTLPAEFRTVAFFVSYREVVACDKCILLNRDCVVAVILRSMRHGRNILEKFEKIPCVSQGCRVK
jgi:hypothetical protein